MQQLCKCAPWATLFNLPQLTKHAKLIIREAHINLIALYILLCNRLELGSGRSIQKLIQDGHSEACFRPRNQPLQIRLGDTSNWIQIRTRAIVLGEVSSVCFINVGRSENE